MTKRLAVVLVAALAVSVSLAAHAAGTIGGSRRSNRGNRNKEPSRYYVILIMDADGSPVAEVVGNTKYSDRRKEIKEEYEEALKDWAQARREAKRAKEEFDEKPPRGPKFVKKLSKSFKEEEDAEEYAGKYQEFIDKKLAEKRGDKPEEGFLDDPDEKKDKDDKKKDEAPRDKKK
jgi:hypothetical protein